MEVGRETYRPLGVVLVEQGLVLSDDVDGALAAQVETSQPLGEILLERSLIARPLLAKALARSADVARGGGQLRQRPDGPAWSRCISFDAVSRPNCPARRRTRSLLIRAPISPLTKRRWTRRSSSYEGAKRSSTGGNASC